MEMVNINYAYNGFLYAPLFLAKELGVFQTRMNPIYRNGDEHAVNSLAIPVDQTNHGKNWFAICDPFAKDITAVQHALGRKDSVCIIASFIHRLPVWAYYGDNSRFRVCGDEIDLVNQREQIKFISCYKPFNTGFMIGDRIRKHCSIAADDMLLQEFEAEFGTTSKPLPAKTLVVTSDVLRLAKNNDFDSGRVVLSYAQRVPELNPFLFTAVLTLKSVIDEHLDAVLSVLSGLRLGTIRLNESESIQLLARYYPDYSSDDLQKAGDALAKEQVYSMDFDLDEAAKAYEKARDGWKAARPDIDFPEAEKCREPVPCLLLRNGWSSDKVLVDLFVKRWKKDADLVQILAKELPRSPLNPHNNVLQIMLAVLLPVFTAIGLFLLVHGWKKVAPENIGYWGICVFMFAIQVSCSIALPWRVLKKFEMEWFTFLGGTILAAFAILVYTETWIVK